MLVIWFSESHSWDRFVWFARGEISDMLFFERSSKVRFTRPDKAEMLLILLPENDNQLSSLPKFLRPVTTEISIILLLSRIKLFKFVSTESLLISTILLSVKIRDSNLVSEQMGDISTILF